MTDKFLGNTGNGLKLNPSGLVGGVQGRSYRSLEELKALSQGKSSKDPEVIKSVAKEIESLFVHEMIKVMRETGETTSNKDFGNSMHMGMFDMEMARFIAEKGIGLQDVLVKELSKRTQKTDEGEAGVRLAISTAQESDDLNSGVSKPEFTNVPVQAQKSNEAESAIQETKQNPKSDDQPQSIFPNLKILLDEPKETEKSQIVSPEFELGGREPHNSSIEQLSDSKAQDFGGASEDVEKNEAAAEGNPLPKGGNRSLSQNPFADFLNSDVAKGIKNRQGTEISTQESEPSIWKTTNPYLALNHFPDLTIKNAKELRKANETIVRETKGSGSPSLGSNHFSDPLDANNHENVQTIEKSESAGNQKPKTPGLESNNPAPLGPDFPEGIQNLKETEENTGKDKPISQILNDLSSDIYNEFSDTEPLLLPIDGRISSHFGMRSHPIYGNMKFHHGVDIAAPAGTEIHPIEKGKVIFSGKQSGYGNVVIIDHGNGFTSKYAHNKANLVKEGDEIDTGTVIGLVGSTGMSTGPHLHFEVRYKGSSINPEEFAKEFEKVSDNISKSI